MLSDLTLSDAAIESGHPSGSQPYSTTPGPSTSAKGKATASVKGNKGKASASSRTNRINAAKDAAAKPGGPSGANPPKKKTIINLCPEDGCNHVEALESKMIQHVNLRHPTNPANMLNWFVYLLHHLIFKTDIVLSGPIRAKDANILLRM